MRRRWPPLGDRSQSRADESVLCTSERLKRNSIVGMRTSATMASDAAWFAAHRVSAWSIALAGVVFLAVGVWLVAVRPGDAAVSGVVLGSAAVVLVVILIGGLQADRVARGVAG